MHELSIAQKLIELVQAQVREQGGAQVRSVRVQIGALSCVHRSALEFSFTMVTASTPLRDAVLVIETIPVTIYCARCDSVEPLNGIQSFRCPRCQTPSADIRSGRELELHSIELEPVLT